ncbi:MAG: nickel pincer cofactor biosynthesis protein LarB [Chloroflexi bacterium]|jgi:NCAIR mutase (PurE)-related protein|nr:nickel pincer cofactor biosynthesis protein LarB [Chloroflexota bacterium]
MPMSESMNLNRVPFAELDLLREHRKGAPEIVWTANKTVPQCIEIARQFLQHTGRAILSRVSPELQTALDAEFGDAAYEWYDASRTAIIRGGHRVPATGGRVGLLTAGTSDQPRAEEAAIVCQEMGCEVYPFYDVGVAGLHRLFGPLEALLNQHDVDVIIVAAGMDGALPSVVSGLVDIPVIGLPTAVGYGMGGQGEAALLTMLQTCAPGLAVVNIDNGVGAGVTAALVANRAARCRKATVKE